MASFKASLPVPLPLYQYLLILLLLLTSKLVFADEKLIQLQCHNADVPVTCVQCVKSDPKGISADKVGIAAIVINCLSKNAENSAKNMSDMASRVVEDNVRAVLQNCSNEFLAAKKNLTDAMEEMIKSKNYDQTNYLVRTAVEQELTCKKNLLDLQNQRIPSSTQLYWMRIYEELTNAALRIIDRF